MDIKKLQYNKKRSLEKKSIRINLKTTETISKFLKKNRLSPQKIWDEILFEIMNKKEFK